MVKIETMTPEEFASAFIPLAADEGRCKLEGNWRRNNRLVKKMNHMLLVLENNPALAIPALQAVMASDSLRA